MSEDATEPPRSAPGTYALLLAAPDERSIEVGALGTMTVRPGPYVYVGSAFGPGGVRARVRRHARRDGARHWHVDYLRAVTTLEGIWYTHDPVRRECAWATVLHEGTGARGPLSGFGASDCDCDSHLVAFRSLPSVARFRERVRAVHPDHATIEQVEGVALLDD